MVPTRTGKMGKVREFYKDWKSQRILPKILEKSGKMPASNNENHASMVPYFK